MELPRLERPVRVGGADRKRVSPLASSFRSVTLPSPALVVQSGSKMAESDLLGPGRREEEAGKESHVFQGKAMGEKLSRTAQTQKKQAKGERLKLQLDAQHQEKDPSTGLSPYSVWRPSRLFEPLSNEDMKAFKASYRAVKEARWLPGGRGGGEAFVNSPTLEQEPSDAVESCLSIEEEEDAEEEEDEEEEVQEKVDKSLLLGHEEHVQEKAEKAAFLLGISEPMEWGLPLDRTTGKLFPDPGSEEIPGNRQENYPGKAAKQALCSVETENKRNFQEGAVGQKKKAKSSAENGLLQSFGFLKNQKVQTVDKPPRCAPCGERFHKRACGEQPCKLPQRGSELPRCVTSLRRDESSPDGQEDGCRSKAKKRGHECGHFLPLSSDRWKAPKGEKLSKGTACGERVSWGSAFPSRDKNDHAGKPHQCFDCGKRFSQKGNLNIHRKTHTGEKPYPCSECGKCFVTNSRLLTHKRVHTGEKPYNCSYCGNNFSQLAHLVQHQRRHTGE
ncbi:hypothetical protein JD844_013673, partial [Phrynosoma platyrhinos]